MNAVKSIRNKDEDLKRFSPFFYETIDRVYIMDQMQGMTCDDIFAHFIVSLASAMDKDRVSVVQEFIILVTMFRKLLNAKGEQKMAAMGEPLQSEPKNSRPEFCADVKASIKVFPELLDYFFDEMFPSYFTNVIVK